MGQLNKSKRNSTTAVDKQVCVQNVSVRQLEVSSYLKICLSIRVSECWQKRNVQFLIFFGHTFHIPEIQ